MHLRIVGAFLSIDPTSLHFERVENGKSSALLFRFEYENRPYLIRILPPKATKEARYTQIQLAQMAAKIGMGPKIHYVDPHLEAIISSFIPGRTATLSDFENEKNLFVFANLLAQLHRSKEPFPLATSPFQRFDHFISSCDMKVFHEPQLVMRTIVSILKKYPRPLCPTHLDLNPQNIIWDGSQFFLIDWVNGGMSDPTFDLANFFISHNLNEKAKQSFLTFYLKRAPTFEENCLLSLCEPIRPFCVAAAFYSSSNQEHAEISHFHLQKGLSLIRSEAFKQALQL